MEKVPSIFASRSSLGGVAKKVCTPITQTPGMATHTVLTAIGHLTFVVAMGVLLHFSLTHRLPMRTSTHVRYVAVQPFLECTVGLFLLFWLWMEHPTQSNEPRCPPLSTSRSILGALGAHAYLFWGIALHFLLHYSGVYELILLPLAYYGGKESRGITQPTVLHAVFGRLLHQDNRPKIALINIGDQHRRHLYLVALLFAVSSAMALARAVHSPSLSDEDYCDAARWGAAGAAVGLLMSLGRTYSAEPRSVLTVLLHAMLHGAFFGFLPGFVFRLLILATERCQKASSAGT